MDTFIKELKLEEIPDGPWKQVAEQIGVENLYTVLRIVGGGTTYIPKAETLIRPVRNRRFLFLLRALRWNFCPFSPGS